MNNIASPLSFRQFGAENGRLVVYFHGVPGAPEECGVFDSLAKAHGLTLICFDRFAIAPTLKGEAYFTRLANEINALAAGRPVDFVGFSIGAFVALQTCRHMAGGVRNLHLVSAAAPLEAGDFLGAMAGKAVFRLAQKRPAFFVALSYWQSLLARLAPKALFRLLFASATGADKALAAEPDFQLGMINVLKSCFLGNVGGYTRDVLAYVRPWNSSLAEISTPTHLWHGTEDNWSPVAMAEYLKAAIPSASTITLFNGLSHYSCLHRAMPEIAKRLAEG